MFFLLNTSRKFPHTFYKNLWSSISKDCTRGAAKNFFQEDFSSVQELQPKLFQNCLKKYVQGFIQAFRIMFLTEIVGGFPAKIIQILLSGFCLMRFLPEFSQRFLSIFFYWFLPNSLEILVEIHSEITKKFMLGDLPWLLQGYLGSFMQDSNQVWLEVPIPIEISPDSSTWILPGTSLHIFPGLLQGLCANSMRDISRDSSRAG